MRELCRGLQFPEGPIAMPDASIVLVEIRRGTLSRVTATICAIRYSLIIPLRAIAVPGMEIRRAAPL